MLSFIDTQPGIEFSQMAVRHDPHRTYGDCDNLQHGQTWPCHEDAGEDSEYREALFEELVTSSVRDCIELDAITNRASRSCTLLRRSSTNAMRPPTSSANISAAIAT